MRLPQRTFALEIPRHVQNSFNFLFCEIQVTNEVATSKICLHCLFLLCNCFIFSGGRVQRYRDHIYTVLFSSCWWFWNMADKHHPYSTTEVLSYIATLKISP